MSKKEAYRFKDLMNKFGVGRTAIYRYRRAGLIPIPWSAGFSKRDVPCWDADEIDQLIAITRLHEPAEVKEKKAKELSRQFDIARGMIKAEDLTNTPAGKK